MGRLPSLPYPDCWSFIARPISRHVSRRFSEPSQRKSSPGSAIFSVALHKEPELAINFQVPLWHSQKSLIAWISKNLPCGYRLLVRDHRKNDGRRPTAFYQDILRYPGVDLISPFDSQFKYIRNAGLIITDNGTTGWEGLIFGKRVISFARNFYEPTGLTERLEQSIGFGKVDSPPAIRA